MRKRLRKAILNLLIFTVVVSMGVFSTSASAKENLVVGGPEKINKYNQTVIPGTDALVNGANTVIDKDSAKPEYPFLCGDIDGNYSINASDALVILKYSVGKTKITENQKEVGDANRDGKINAGDALFALQVSVDKKSPIKHMCPHLMVTLNNNKGEIKKANGIVGASWTPKTFSGGIGIIIMEGVTPMCHSDGFNYRFHYIGDNRTLELRCDNCNQTFMQKLYAPYK